MVAIQIADSALDGYLENEMVFSDAQTASLAFEQLKQPTKNARIEKRERHNDGLYYVLVFDYPEGAPFWI